MPESKVNSDPSHSRLGFFISNHATLHSSSKTREWWQNIIHIYLGSKITHSSINILNLIPGQILQNCVHFELVTVYK